MPSNQAPVRGFGEELMTSPMSLDRDRRAVLIGDDDVAELAGVEQLIVGVERELLMRAFEIAFRRIRASHCSARC